MGVTISTCACVHHSPSPTNHHTAHPHYTPPTKYHHQPSSHTRKASRSHQLTVSPYISHRQLNTSNIDLDIDTDKQPPRHSIVKIDDTTTPTRTAPLSHDTSQAGSPPAVTTAQLPRLHSATSAERSDVWHYHSHDNSFTHSPSPLYPSHAYTFSTPHKGGGMHSNSNSNNNSLKLKCTLSSYADKPSVQLHHPADHDCTNKSSHQFLHTPSTMYTAKHHNNDHSHADRLTYSHHSNTPSPNTTSPNTQSSPQHHHDYHTSSPDSTTAKHYQQPLTLRQRSWTDSENVSELFEADGMKQIVLHDVSTLPVVTEEQHQTRKAKSAPSRHNRRSTMTDCVVPRKQKSHRHVRPIIRRLDVSDSEKSEDEIERLVDSSDDESAQPTPRRQHQFYMTSPPLTTRGLMALYDDGEASNKQPQANTLSVSTNSTTPVKRSAGSTRQRKSPYAEYGAAHTVNAVEMRKMMEQMMHQEQVKASS